MVFLENCINDPEGWLLWETRKGLKRTNVGHDEVPAQYHSCLFCKKQPYISLFVKDAVKKS